MVDFFFFLIGKRRLFHLAEQKTSVIQNKRRDITWDIPQTYKWGHKWGRKGNSVADKLANKARHHMTQLVVD